MPRRITKKKATKRFPIKDVSFIYDEDKTHKGEWGDFKQGKHHNFFVEYRGKEIGDMSVFEVTSRNRYKGYVFVNTVFVNPKYRGKGVGRLLYTSVLNRFSNICTHYHAASDDAQAVWRYLSKKYRSEIDYFKDLLFIFKY